MSGLGQVFTGVEVLLQPSSAPQPADVGLCLVFSAAMQARGPHTARTERDWHYRRETWQRTQLCAPDAADVGACIASNGQYLRAVQVAASGGSFAAFFEALDDAGNVSVETSKGTLGTLHTLYLPIVARDLSAQPAPASPRGLHLPVVVR